MTPCCPQLFERELRRWAGHEKSMSLSSHALYDSKQVHTLFLDCFSFEELAGCNSVVLTAKICESHVRGGDIRPPWVGVHSPIREKRLSPPDEPLQGDNNGGRRVAGVLLQVWLRQ